MIRGRFAAPALAVFSLTLMSISAGPATADTNDPVGDLLTTVTKLVSPAPAPAKTAVVAPPPQQPGGTSPGNTTPPPAGPDHGSTQGVETTLGGTNVAGVSQDDATVNDDDSTTADATLLSLGGNDVLFAPQADSSGTQHTSFDPLNPLTGALCDGSTGAVCLKVLYANANATDDGSTSHSDSSSGLASACLGGTSTVNDGSCDGALSTGVATSHAEADRDQASGETTASSEYHTANVCVGPQLLCQVGVTAVDSQGQADSGDGATPSSASRSSSVLGLQLAGGAPTDFTTPTDLSIQPACATPSLICLFLNQGETYLGSGTAGHVQDALKLTVLPVLPGTNLVFTGIGHTETLVHNDGGNPPPNPPNPPKRPKHHDGVDDGVLPNTGGLWSGLLALGLIGVAAGSFLVAAGRRERVALG